MKNRFIKGSLAALVATLATNAFAATEVTVYTAFEADILAKYKNALEQANPDIQIKW
ncbi:putative 2-aminoethylphosphonate ABC transporter substrate-binding protein, partial [Vibrio sp. 10N.261.45.A4]